MNSEKQEKIDELGKEILELKLREGSRKEIRKLHIKYDELIKELKKNK